MFDVLVVGGGAAGGACATLLAGAGLRVALAAEERPRHRPAEVMAPNALRTLAALGLPLPEAGPAATRCRGVLSAWGDAAPAFHDYELLACGAALAVDRDVYDRRVVAAAAAAGAEIVRGRLTARREATDDWLGVAGGGAVRARWLVDATGRGGRVVAPGAPARRAVDRLVGLSVHHDARPSCGEALLLEAAPGGWWYVVPRPSGGSSIVYMTDADLLPRGTAERAEWLRRAFCGTRLLRAQLGEVPRFVGHRGWDARTSGRASVTGEGWVVVGDAALAGDPLSGDGVHRAVLGAAAAARAIARALGDGSRAELVTYTTWCATTAAGLVTERARAYLAARRVWPQERFWQRREAG